MFYTSLTVSADISQWAVFAIHNLCEDNHENQVAIAALEQTGIANASAALDFGCEVEVGDDGKVKVKLKAAAAAKNQS